MNENFVMAAVAFSGGSGVRGLLPRDGAVAGIDLAEDKQTLVVIDHDGRVLARKTARVKAFRLGEALDWAVGQARLKGFAQEAFTALVRTAVRDWGGVGDHRLGHPGQLSPGRPALLTSPVERCRGRRPHHAGQPSPLALRRARRAG